MIGGVKQTLLLLASLAAPALANLTTDCGLNLQPPCIVDGVEVCMIPDLDAGGRSEPNAAGLCVACGFSGRGICNSSALQLFL